MNSIKPFALRLCQCVLWTSFVGAVAASAQVQVQSQNQTQYQNQTHSQDKFPDPRDSYLKTAPYISAERVRSVTQSVRVAGAGGRYPGMHKDQVRQELGHPHFNEGIGSNKEWNYIFNLQPPVAVPVSGPVGLQSQPMVCQFKVLFNDDDLVTDTRWNHPTCTAIANVR